MHPLDVGLGHVRDGPKGSPRAIGVRHAGRRLIAPRSASRPSGSVAWVRAAAHGAATAINVASRTGAVVGKRDRMRIIHHLFARQTTAARSRHLECLACRAIRAQVKIRKCSLPSRLASQEQAIKRRQRALVPLVPHAVAFGLQVALRVRIGPNDHRQSAVDRHASLAAAAPCRGCCSSAGCWAHRSASASRHQFVGAGVIRQAQQPVGIDGVMSLGLQLIGPDLVHQANAPALLAQVEDDPAPWAATCFMARSSWSRQSHFSEPKTRWSCIPNAP